MPEPSASAWRPGSTPPGASRTPPIATRAPRSRRPRRGAAAGAEAQRAEPGAADDRGDDARGGGGDGSRPAAAGSRAVGARLARRRRRHRRVAGRGALSPAGDPAQRGRRRGQGLRAQHPCLRPARRRRAYLRPPASPSAGTAPPAGSRLRRAEITAFREAFVAEAAAALSDDDLTRVRRVDAVVGGDELTSRASPTSSSCSRRTGSATGR